MIAGELKRILEDVPDDAVILIPNGREDGEYVRGAFCSLGFADPDDDSVDGIYAELYAYPKYNPGHLEGNQYYVLAFGYEWAADRKRSHALYQSA